MRTGRRIGCGHGIERVFDRGRAGGGGAGRAGPAGSRHPGPGRPRPGQPAGRGRGRAGAGPAANGGPAGRPLAPRTGRGGWPWCRRRRIWRAGVVHRQLATPPTTAEQGRRLPGRADRPGAVPRAAHGYRPGPCGRGAVGRARRRAGQRHRRPARSHHGRGRAGAAGGRRPVGSAGAAAGGGPPAVCRRPRRGRRRGATPIRPAWGVVGAHLGRHGRPRRAPGPRGRPDPAGRPGTPGPPHRRRG
jgi:hypothetical protein